MSSDLAIYLSKQLFWTAFLISSPVVLVALVSGLLVSILQVITQIQDSTLSIVPKMLAVILMLMFAGEWMLSQLMVFSISILKRIPESIL